MNDEPSKSREGASSAALPRAVPKNHQAHELSLQGTHLWRRPRRLWSYSISWAFKKLAPLSLLPPMLSGAGVAVAISPRDGSVWGSVWPLLVGGTVTLATTILPQIVVKETARRRAMLPARRDELIDQSFVLSGALNAVIAGYSWDQFAAPALAGVGHTAGLVAALSLLVIGLAEAFVSLRRARRQQRLHDSLRALQAASDTCDRLRTEVKSDFRSAPVPVPPPLESPSGTAYRFAFEQVRLRISEVEEAMTALSAAESEARADEETTALLRVARGLQAVASSQSHAEQGNAADGASRRS